MFFDILLPLSCVIIGLFLGWTMHALHRGVFASTPVDRYHGDHDPAAKSAGQDGDEGPDPVVPKPEIVSPEKVNAVTKRLRTFAARLAERIDSHQTRIEAVSSALNANDLSETSPVVLDAVEQLLSANESMRTELEESQKRLREQTVELQTATQRAQTDSLTGLLNRRTFDEQLSLHHSRGSQQAGVLVLADIDHFKAFNDTHGHRCGDEVLRSVASMLEARLEPYGKVARFGGEEFVALIENDHFDEVIKLIEKTRQAIGDREIRFEGQRLKVSLSVGMGELGELESGKQQSSEQWLQRVDDALYRSKDVGRDCTHYVDGERFVRVGGSSKKATPASEAGGSTSAHSGNATEPPANANHSNANHSNAPDRQSSEGPRSIDVERPSNRVESRVSSASSSSASSSSASSSSASSSSASSNSASSNSASSNSASSNSDASNPQRAESSVDNQSVVNEPVQSPEALETLETIARLTTQLANAEVTKPPKGLSYLPSLDAMIDSICEKLPEEGSASRPMHLMVLTLSGSPNGATMRGVLQIVRAALRSQDRVGCLNHSTLLVSFSECTEAEVVERAEQICHSAGSVGVQLASKERTSDGERLSVGIVQLETARSEGIPFEPAPDSIEDAILQARVTALRAGQQSSREGALPVLTHVAEVRGASLAY